MCIYNSWLKNKIKILITIRVFQTRSIFLEKCDMDTINIFNAETFQNGILSQNPDSLDQCKLLPLLTSMN